MDGLIIAAVGHADWLSSRVLGKSVTAKRSRAGKHQRQFGEAENAEQRDEKGDGHGDHGPLAHAAAKLVRVVAGALGRLSHHGEEFGDASGARQ